MDPTDAGPARDGTAPPDTGTLDAGVAPCPFPDCWEPVPFLADWCDAWRPRGAASDTIRPLRFEPCDPPTPACDRLVVDWPRESSSRRPLGFNTGLQTSGTGRPIAVILPFTRGPDEPRYYDYALFAHDGTPLAVWRIRRRTEELDPFCRTRALSITGDEIAIAFAEDGVLDPSHPWGLVIVIDRLDRIQRASEQRYRHTEAEGGYEARELVHDGTNAVFQPVVSAIMAGWMDSRPFEPLAWSGTDDAENTTPILHRGDLYWSGSPATGSAWLRIRRRRAGALVNETFLERARAHLDAFRTDGEWATWVASIDDTGDGLADRSEVLAARTGASLDPGTWTPRVVSDLPFPNVANGLDPPILSDGMLVYHATDEIELVDLARDRMLEVPRPTRLAWMGIAHLGPEYLVLTYQDQSDGIVALVEGLRRYRIAELEGWTPIE